MLPPPPLTAPLAPAPTRCKLLLFPFTELLLMCNLMNVLCSLNSIKKCNEMPSAIGRLKRCGSPHVVVEEEVAVLGGVGLQEHWLNHCPQPHQVVPRRQLFWPATH